MCAILGAASLDGPQDRPSQASRPHLRKQLGKFAAHRIFTYSFRL